MILWGHRNCLGEHAILAKTVMNLQITFASEYYMTPYTIQSRMNRKYRNIVPIIRKFFSVRYMDMAVMIPTFFYFVFLTWCLLKQWKVIVNRPLCAVLFSFVYMVTICGLVCKAIAMTISYQEDAYKVQTSVSSAIYYRIIYCIITRCLHCYCEAPYWCLS